MFTMQCARRFRGACQTPSARGLSTTRVLMARILKSGDKIPLIKFDLEGLLATPSAPGADQDKIWDSLELFEGRRSLVFLDSAPTSEDGETHLAEYEKSYDSIKTEGIHEIYCASEDAGDVMRKLLISQGCIADTMVGLFGFQKVKPLPGGHRLFRPTGSLSMMNALSSDRHQGSAIIINEMKVEKLFETPKQRAGEAPTATVTKVLSYLRENMGAKKGWTEHYSPHTNMITSISSASSVSDIGAE